MFGTRNLILQSQSSINSVDQQQSPPSPHLTFLRRLYQQSKQISQIVAFIWRWADDPKDIEKSQVAKKLKTYFEHPTLVDGIEIDGQLKKLFKVIPDPKGNDESQLLYTVFGNHNNSSLIFPIFDSFELGEKDAKLGYSFMIDIEHYYGEIKDPTRNCPNMLTFKLPYPPRPQLGELTVTQQELEAWVNNRNSDQYLADNVYIPTSSC